MCLNRSRGLLSRSRRNGAMPASRAKLSWPVATCMLCRQCASPRSHGQSLHNDNYRSTSRISVGAHVLTATTKPPHRILTTKTPNNKSSASSCLAGVLLTELLEITTGNMGWQGSTFSSPTPSNQPGRWSPKAQIRTLPPSALPQTQEDK